MLRLEPPVRSCYQDTRTLRTTVLSWILPVPDGFVKAGISSKVLSPRKKERTLPTMYHLGSSQSKAVLLYCCSVLAYSMMRAKGLIVIRKGKGHSCFSFYLLNP